MSRIHDRPFVSISSLEDKSKEGALKAFDVNGDGLLSEAEAARFVLSRKPQLAGKSTDTILEHGLHATDVFALAGSRAVDQYAKWSVSFQDTSTASRWKGDFHSPGLGAGNVRVEPTADPPRLAFHVDCNLIGAHDLRQYDATLVVARKGFAWERGATVPEQLVFPLANHAGPGLSGAVSMDVLQKLMGGSAGLSFYVRLDSAEGPRFLNRDGVAGRNFEVTRADLGR